MAIDRSSFLLITGALAAGGAGGYYAHQQGLIGNPGTTSQQTSTPEPLVVERGDAAAPVASAAAPVPTTVVTAAALPVCDDSQGSAGDCPAAMGMPTDEGGCGNFVTTRCQDFKTSMKPRVAESAVQCLRDLKPAERCDKARVNLCGHLALVNACAEPESSSSPTAIQVVGTAGSPASQGAVANVAAVPSGTPPTTVNAEPARPGSAAAVCETILKSVGTSRLGPTLADCKQTLSGLNDTGRTRMVECMKKDWSTKGLLGCEAMDLAASASSAKKGG
ncbi:MAG: hypothetical protein EOP08_15440 [Proteobacteria bacterium]|nr:MAG: hypothetical protein EOP08_15440 [Pseudomonadota bacterium]